MASDFRRPEALSLNGNVAENWRIFKTEFTTFLEAKEADQKADKTKIAMLLNALGPDARERYEQLTWNVGEDKTNYDHVIIKLDTHFKGKKRLVFMRYKFWSYQRPEGQPFLDYLTTLKQMANQCEFTETDNMVRDKIVFSTTDQELKEKLLEIDDLTLDKAREKCVAAETTRKEARLMSTDIKDERHLHGVKKKHRSMNTRQSTDTKKSYKKTADTESKSKRICDNCGLTHPPKKCPAFGKECLNCHKKNHYAKMCRSRSKRSSAVSTDYYYSDDDSYDLDMGEVKHVSGTRNIRRAWFEMIDVLGTRIPFKVDTGAEANLLPEKLWAKCVNKLHEQPYLRKRRVTLKTVTGKNINYIGMAEVPVKIKRQTATAEIFVTKERTTPILGLQTAMQLKLLLPGENATARIINSVESKSKPKLTEEILKQEYGTVFSKKLGKYPGQYKIRLTEDAQPKINPPRRVPHKMMQPLKKKLHDMVEEDVIEPVDHPTDWVNSMVCTEKKDGSLRLCLDPRTLNKYIKREHYMIPTFQEVITRLGRPKFFTIIDQSSAFWQVELDEESRDLTTFQTPFGRYRFKRMPFGISSATEVLQKKSFQIFGDIDHVHIINDDMLIEGDTEEEHDEAMCKVLDRAIKNNIKFNLSKLRFKKQEVVYHGTKFTTEGIQADSSKVKAILNMPDPVDKQGVQRFLGIVNYLTPFIPNKAQITEPLRQLLKDKAPWNWGKPQQEAMKKIKQLLSSEVLLKYYDETKPLTIQADASQDGLGACLLQDGKPICYASRSMNETEQRYAQIEKELLAIVFATQRFHHYIYGTEVTIQSDHKPLESIQKKDLHKLSPRLQLMMLKLLLYKINIVYTPGSKMHIADALSRAALKNSEPDKRSEDMYVHSVMTYYPASKKKIEEYKDATEKDATSIAIKQYIKHGWPERKNLPPEMIPYFDRRDEIYEDNGLLFIANRLIIPEAERQFALERLHTGHQGMEKTKSYARDIVYWPGMSKDIDNMISNCKVCQKYRRNNVKEPIQQHEIPEERWQKLGADIFHFGKEDYLILVDYYSKYPELAKLKSKSATAVIQAMKIIFARQGIPETVIADNMPFGSVEFRQFAKDWNFTIVTSSPRYPQSNGEAEKYVGIVKMMLRKCKEDGTDPNLALLRYRNTPITGMKYSPAQMLFSRRLREQIPVKQILLKPQIATESKKQLKIRQQKQAKYYNKNCRARTDFKTGQNVRVKVDPSKEWIPGIVNNPYSTPRSYVVTTSKGQTVRRNTRMMNRTPEKITINPPYADIRDGHSEAENINVERPIEPEALPVNPPTPEVAQPEPRVLRRETHEPSKFKDFVTYKPPGRKN